jgi:TetR/AcrR family transcriptional regulator, transcriptional repressor for nem operon
MPYPARHRAEVKAKIVQSARRLFNRHGFDNVSIGQIMASAGLTHGGFYSYFGSKSDLYIEVLGCFFTDPNWKNCWEGVKVDLSSADVGPQVVRAYLSRNILRTWRIRVRWRHCRPMWRVAGRGRSALSKRCSRQW